MKHLSVCTMILLATCALPCVAQAKGGDAAREVATAIEHAHFAEAAPSVAVTHLHLHHVINCLVGLHGRGFDAAAGDPCKGMGNGALNDSPRTSEMYGLILNALAMARRGIAAHKLPAAHKAASEVIEILQSGHEKTLTGNLAPPHP
jgi:hypothetical protein